VTSTDTLFPLGEPADEWADADADPAPSGAALVREGPRVPIDEVIDLLDQGRNDEARERLRALRVESPRDIRLAVFEAHMCLNEGYLEEAAALLAEARLLPGAERKSTSTQIARVERDLCDVREELQSIERARRLAEYARRQAKTGARTDARAPRVVTPPPRPPAPSRPAAPDVELRVRHAPTRTTLAAPGGSADDGGGHAATPAEALLDWQLRQAAVRVEAMRRYDTLLALAVARGVDQYEYQLRTVRRVLRDFRGRALLADEVGLGKTIEAALCLEEYLQRGLVRRALLLVPPGLVDQWRDELMGKFGREAVNVDGPRTRRDPGVWDTAPIVLTSMALARREPHATRLAAARFDMVVVDEAHRLKNRRTQLWRLVDRMRSRFLLLLSATPVENDLFEIYNVLSLLRPGLFSTVAEFKRAFVAGSPRQAKDPGRLRALLREVMIRNTRALAEAKLPPRFVTTIRAEADEREAAFYRDLSAAVRAGLAANVLTRGHAAELLRAAGARPRAAERVLLRHVGEPLAERAAALEITGKDRAFLDLLRRRPGDKVLVFATHVDTLPHLVALAREAGRKPVLFSGSLSPGEKAAALETFRGEADCLVSSEAGGEGHNLHFARTIVNYDLPWNPMRIEQRIGRVHRIGQTRDVFVFNLVAAGTIEEEILRVLDEKINMFELVVGEVEGILGRLGDDEQEFAELVLDLYAGAADEGDARRRFDALAERMLGARKEHERVKALETRLFGRDLEA
jgi:superfamily II DNA or RNA helicase